MPSRRMEGWHRGSISGYDLILQSQMANKLQNEDPHMGLSNSKAP